MNKIKVGDTVVVTTGKDKLTKNKKGELVPTTGKVLKVDSKNDRVIVEGVNKVKKHKKAKQQDAKGGIFEEEAAIHVSNVMLLDPKTNKPTRVGFIEKTHPNGKKYRVRVAKKSGTVLDN